MKRDKSVIFSLVLVFLLLGCRSRIQYIPVESKTEARDSVITRDSIVIKEKVVTRDSTVTKDSTVIILDDKGNVIRTELYREKERYRELNSDYRLLQAKYDSLQSLKNKVIEIPYPVEKQLTRWQQTKMDVGGWAIGALSGMCILGMGYVVRWLIRKRK